YGIDQFALTCPCKGWRSTGLPPEEFYRERAEVFKKIRDAVAPEGIQCGWWNILTLKSGPDPRWNRMIRMDGTETPMASCPLNPVFRETFARNVALFVKIAKPAFVITEDDFSINAAAQYEGCFCEHHLAEFARREGRTYTREELKAILEQTTPESHELRRRWRTLMRDSLVLFAKAIRDAVDEESPEVPMGTMQSGGSDHDGDMTEALARAMAGPAHTPFSRLYGTFYGGENITGIPEKIFHALYSKQHLGENFKCYHESDTYPHTRFFTSATSMRVLMSTSYSYGFCGSTFQTQQILDDANEETAYGKLIGRERNRFQAIADAAAHCRLKGVRVHYDPFRATTDPDRWYYTPWTGTLSKYSIPYTTLESDTVFLSGDQPMHLDREDLMRILSKSVFLDGDAAAAICRLGLSRYIGVETGSDPITGMNVYDLGGREVIQPEFIPDHKGRNMHRADVFSPGGKGKHYSLTPIDPACEIITKLFSYKKDFITVGMTRFVNELGGKVVVLNQAVYENHSSSLYNYRRQKLFQELLIWCNDEFAFVKDEARIFLIMNEASDPENAGFRGMLTISNLNPDPVEGFALHLPPAWRGCEFLRLTPDGKYLPCPAEETEDGANFNFNINYAYPEVLLIR
ncbi:MAG: hypothetical protein J6W00_01340, partial [Lentisphaeria bacterium]|nr:hypothetical protein [Lentisphaeria bacterium]